MLSQLFEFGVLLGVPAMFVGIAYSLMWSQLSKPWVFVALCLVLLYALYSAIFYFAAPNVVSMDLVVPSNQLPQGAGATTGELQEGRVWFPFLAAYLRPVVLFSIAAFPMLWLVIKFCRK